jgi:MscS family membrane protein
MAVCEWIIRSPRIQDKSIDAELLRLATKAVSFFCGLLIIIYGTHLVGIPTVSMLAGLGIGGVAVALAIRPTLENLFGGIILFIDRPVRIGDFCSFGDNMGTVEKIGARSTQIRAHDRTVVSIPNASLAGMNIVNWARCDQLLIHTKLGLRYETKPDQLRFALAKMREMCLAHPKIDSDSVRIRFTGYGSSSLEIEIRIFVLTTNWNEFHAVREDVFLRIADIVDESGSGFAFSSSTLYLGRDKGLDQSRGEIAVQEVQSWRSSGRLPFPDTPLAERDRVKDTLDYPPHGSTHVSQPVKETEQAEQLAAEPVSSEVVEEKHSHGPERK